MMRTWRWPILIATLSTAGLAIGLMNDGWADILASALVGTPLAVCLWCLL